MKIYIGTSGWQYYHWRGKFYPENLDSKNFLKFYSKHFNTVEINTSFYHLTKKTTFEKWKNEISDLRRKNKNDFLFAVKLYRLFTHLRRLKLKKEDEKTLKTFLENVSALKENLGPILIQLPPSFKDKEVLKKFIKKFKTIIKNVFKNRLPLIALEIRNKNLLTKDVYNFLRKEKIIFVISDSPRWPTDFVKTTDIVYVRFHGKPILFASKYSKKELKKYAEKIKKLKPKVLFAYFNNDAEGYAIENALEFNKIIISNDKKRNKRT
ncbi:hypothetical protein HRbin35_00216 [bacterium HR35]|nr:hypothetical protein HRbin35_00216 [bacterium HR35]